MVMVIVTIREVGLVVMSAILGSDKGFVNPVWMKIFALHIYSKGAVSQVGGALFTRWQVVQHQPIQAKMLYSFHKLIEIHWFAHV